MSANYCSHIEEHTNDLVYADIEKEVEYLETNTRQYFMIRLFYKICLERELRDKAVRELREQLEDMIQKDEE